MKSNPLNMTNLTRQYYNYLTYYETSRLSINQLLLGTTVYLLLFFILGYLVFRKKRF
ncbi:hypothetical protein HU830_04670 [Lactobacillus sp. DCY120]|uniref:ABC transporter permease n=1 Tax=Bombilactobacillus apium TaxID=2675299 RepID=A0A850R0M5_9LACO|nr:hypothetical protein [Bombilactobacillus apium]NVY96463.1 hypothetical protein [Bombilactobacillus apium]